MKNFYQYREQKATFSKLVKGKYYLYDTSKKIVTDGPFNAEDDPKLMKILTKASDSVVPITAVDAVKESGGKYSIK